ncbi:ABC transporter [Staphylococcus saccharolyticus]|uniref:ABC transporter n=1 Tax=Staphylococcus saccharolyticus TaxID=33028 RepID=A0A380HA10_9STAP|nr:ABC transporter [Staphylococcus saccharolyticus]
MISRVEVLQNIYLRVYNPPIVIGFTSLVSLVTMLFFSPLHALLIAVSMMLTLWFVPWISAKRVRLIKQYVSHEQREFLTRFYDYNESYEELNRFKQTEQFKNDVINRLKKYDYMQLKEQKFLSLYDYVLNIIAMVSIFMSLLLGAQQVYTGQLNEVYLTSIVLMVLTLFEQAVPMSNVAFYKADTDQALDEINEVIAPVTTEMSGISNNNHSELSLFEMKDVTFSYWNQQTPTTVLI